MHKALVILALFTTFVASAAEYSDLYIIPVAGHSRGAYGTSWRSDVVLHNIQDVPITVEMAMIESGRAASTEPVTVSAAIHLNPGETRLLSDVAGQLGRDIVGALIVGADRPLAVTSRTYAEHTLGQTVPPVAITGTADAVNEIAVLPSLLSSDGQRSNIGLFAAASHAPLVIEIALLSSSGAPLGTQLLTVDEPGFIHRQLSLSPAMTNVTAIVRILEGDGIVVPYASIIDNASAEAIFLASDAISAGGAAARSMLTTMVTRWRGDTRLR